MAEILLKALYNAVHHLNKGLRKCESLGRNAIGVRYADESGLSFGIYDSQGKSLKMPIYVTCDSSGFDRNYISASAKEFEDILKILSDEGNSTANLYRASEGLGILCGGFDAEFVSPVLSDSIIRNEESASSLIQPVLRFSCDSSELIKTLSNIKRFQLPLRAADSGCASRRLMSEGCVFRFEGNRLEIIGGSDCILYRRVLPCLSELNGVYWISSSSCRDLSGHKDLLGMSYYELPYSSDNGLFPRLDSMLSLQPDCSVSLPSGLEGLKKPFKIAKVQASGGNGRTCDIPRRGFLTEIKYGDGVWHCCTVFDDSEFALRLSRPDMEQSGFRFAVNSYIIDTLIGSRLSSDVSMGLISGPDLMKLTTRDESILFTTAKHC